MPYLKTKDESELQLARPGGNRGTFQPTSAAPAPAQPGPGSGDYVNIGRYIDANKAASDRTAQQMGDSIEEQGRGARDAVNSASDQFRMDAAKGSFSPERAGEDRATPAYSGPGSMADNRGFGELTTKVQDASSRANTAANGYGLQAQMQDSNKGSSYTGGQSALDAALVGASGGRRFQQLKGQYGGLGGYLDETNKDSAAYGKSAADASEAARADYDANAAARAAAEEAARQQAEAEAARQAQQEQMRANEGHGDLQETTVSINDEKAAMNDGLYYEWLKAGSPPYDDWKASRGG